MSLPQESEGPHHTASRDGERRGKGIIGLMRVNDNDNELGLRWVQSLRRRRNGGGLSWFLPSLPNPPPPPTQPGIPQHHTITKMKDCGEGVNVPCPPRVWEWGWVILPHLTLPIHPCPRRRTGRRRPTKASPGLHETEQLNGSLGPQDSEDSERMGPGRGFVGGRLARLVAREKDLGKGETPTPIGVLFALKSDWGWGQLLSRRIGDKKQRIQMVTGHGYGVMHKRLW